MKQEILTRFPWPWLPTLALMIFFCFFVVLCFRTFSKSRRPVFAAAEKIPMNDGEKV